ncbi:NUDIX hydrolase [Bacteroides heparinolyticus]|uniref:NUDIX hydrolase n=1 Tax=Prevotella heparinolytica TaxID=28113 RepID=UPI0035A11CCF
MGNQDMQTPIRRLKRELAYEGTILKVYKDYIEANGHHAVWDFIHHDGAAAVVAVADDGKLIMVRQYRNALDRFTLEIPAGKVDNIEEPRVLCAFRELEEEIGMKVDKPEDLEFLLRIDTTVAFCNEEIDIFVAKNLKPGRQHLDTDEYIRVEYWEIKDLLDLIYKGEIRDGKTVSAILAYYAKYC